ncbi:MAG: LamG-like jellyroll fold domain-containing protein [Prosthecobacter sp.]
MNTASDVKDSATNALASSVTSAAVTLDNDPPGATSITPSTTGPTSANTLDFTIGFDEAVTGFNAFSDLTLITTGSVTATGATFSGSGDSYTVTLTGVDGDGTLKIAVNTGSDVTDVLGNPLDTSVTSAAVTIDNTGASVTAIVPATTGPTNANTVAFIVTFDEAVTGLDALADLVITSTSSAAATGASFSGSGTNWTVTLTGVSGDGTLKLAIATGGNVLDSLNNPLQNSVTSTAVTIDNTGPTVSSITPATTGPTNATSVNFAVVFSDAVTGLDAISDLVITTTNTAGVGSASFSGTGASRTVSLGGITGNGTITLAIKTGGDVIDAAGNSLSSSVTSAAVTIDNTGPTITSITPATTGPTNATTLSFSVQADEALQGLDAFADLNVQTTGSAAVSGANITGTGSVFTVVLNGVVGKGTIALAVSTGSDVTDQSGNPLASSVLSAAVNVDRVGPMATSITPDVSSPTNADTIHYTVTLNEPVTGLDSASDLLITTDAGVTYTSVAVSGSDDTYTVTVDGLAGDGDLTIAVDPAGDVKDLAGNALTSSTLTTITLDNTRPTVLSITPSFIGPLTSDSVDFDVVFSEPVDGFNDASALQISYGGTLRFADILFSGSGTNYAVILSGRTGDGVIDIQVKTNSGVADAAGNAPASSSPSPTVRIIDGPLLNWDLEEGSGTHIWEQTFGTPNVATLQGPATWVPGIAPNASHAISLGVDDPSSYVDAGTVKNDGTYGKDTADYRVLISQWSITAWVQLAEPQSTSSERIIVSSDWDSGNGFTFGLRSGGSLAFDFGSNPVDSGIQLPTGRPFFVAIIADHSTGTFGDGTSRHQFAVWDGRAWQKVNGTDFANIRLQGLELGSFNSGQRQWDGLIDSVAIYDRALTTTDLGNLVAYAPVSQAYTDWAVASGLNPLFQGGPYDDPNGDGKTNLEHFAFDGDPLSAIDDGKHREAITDVSGTNHFAITIPVRSGAVFSGSPSPTATIDGITYAFQGTLNLVSWDELVSEVVPPDSAGLPSVSSGWEYRTFILDNASLTRGFLRGAVDVVAP